MRLLFLFHNISQYIHIYNIYVHIYKIATTSLLFKSFVNVQSNYKGKYK